MESEKQIPGGAVAQRARILRELIAKRGIVSVLKSAKLDEVDLSILDLLVGFEKESAERQEVMEFLKNWRSKRPAPAGKKIRILGAMKKRKLPKGSEPVPETNRGGES